MLYKQNSHYRNGSPAFQEVKDLEQSCRGNIYRIGEEVPDGYKWNLSGRRLAVLYRFISAFFVPVVWVFLVIFLEWHVIRIGSLTAGGILWTVVALVVLFYSVLFFLNHLFFGISRRLDPEAGSSSLSVFAGDSAVSGYDSGEGSDDSFSAQNAMQAVYEYLKNNGAYQELRISYSANAKGDLYARIGSGSEAQGAEERSYELRLYDNGEKESDSGICREIVLEKVYTAGDGETELLDFFLVHPETLEVTDEHKTDW